MKRYPMLSNWVTGRDYRFGNIVMRNEITEKVYRIDPEAYAFLLRLDGDTYPYTLDCPTPSRCWSVEDVDEMLSELMACGLARDPGFYDKRLTSLYRTVHIFKNWQSDSLLLKILNTVMWLAFLPVFIFGLVVFLPKIDSIQFSDHLLLGLIGGMLAGLVLGSALHECGHVVAALAAGGRVFEVGVHLTCLIMPGAYSLIKENESASGISKIQTAAVGIEMNLILAGIALIILSFLPPCPEFFLAIAIVNTLLTLDNILLVGGIDGYRVFSRLFGLDAGITDAARHMLFTGGKCRKLLNDGCTGKAAFCSYCLVLLLAAAGFSLRIVVLIEVISCII